MLIVVQDVRAIWEASLRDHGIQPSICTEAHLWCNSLIGISEEQDVAFRTYSALILRASSTNLSSAILQLRSEIRYGNAEFEYECTMNGDIHRKH